MEIMPTELKPEDRLPWHKPEIQRLIVSLDTASEVVSGGEIDAHS